MPLKLSLFTDIPINAVELTTNDILQQTFSDIKKLKKKMKMILRLSDDKKSSEYKEALEKVKEIKKEVEKVESSVDTISRTYNARYKNYK